jgi:hypothetical protein
VLSCFTFAAASSCDDASGTCRLATEDTNVFLQAKLAFEQQHQLNEAMAKLLSAKGAKLQDVDIGAMIVEPRCHIALPVVVHNMRKRLPSLPIQLFYSDDNADCVQAWFSVEENITLTKLDSDFFLGSGSPNDISWLFTNDEFWKKVLHDKVLVFQQDSWVCRDAEAKLGKFLRYDYIGAPWIDGQFPECDGVGNGGFSLRTVKVMQAIAKKFGQTTQEEDKYFCGHLRGWKSLANMTSAGQFSAEQWDGSQDHAPLGTHKAEYYSWFGGTPEGVALQKNCPGLDLLYTVDEKAKSYVYDHKDAVRLGNEFLQQARSQQVALLAEEDFPIDTESLFAVTFTQ